MSKSVLGVSLGDSGRDFETTVEMLDKTVHVRRQGTDGDLKMYVELLEANDGRVDAIGFGGFDLYLWCAGRRYTWHEPKSLLKRVKQTPVLDGSGLKNTLERLTIHCLQEREIVDFGRSNTLLVCAVDRFGMAESIWDQGGEVVYGDLMFGLGFPIPIRTLQTAQFVARVTLPFVTHMPIKWLYPTGKKQLSTLPKFEKYYKWADIICGDCHYIRRHMPSDLQGKVVITNTTTEKDVELFRRAGVRRLVTTTPVLGGRSPGTNIFEATIVAALGRDPSELTIADYEDVLQKIGWTPTILEL